MGEKTQFILCIQQRNEHVERVFDEVSTSTRDFE